MNEPTLESPKKQNFFQILIGFLEKVKFRYSIVIILVFAVIFIMIFPSFLSLKRLTKEFWGLINGTSETFKMLLGMAIGYYFSNKANENHT